ncbi:ribosomal L7/L12 family protein [Anaerosinus massiliensis]|uniref:hypothetical protein n=1 Tax=Massilibacillus massiliensis TaxID=1806837 RepID=UPI000AFFE0D1|nr:hypothetical protein [Massilibacillus massiliensis]
MKKNAIILLCFFLWVAATILIFGWVIPVIIQFYLHNDEARGITLLFIFIGVVLLKRFTWQNYLVYVIAVFSLIGMIGDTTGNFVYNKPLEWLLSSFGELQIVQNIYNYVPGEYVISNDLILLGSDGSKERLSEIWLYLYRFIQYLITYSILGSLLSFIIDRLPAKRMVIFQKVENDVMTEELAHKVAEELKRREDEKNSKLIISEDIKAELLKLKKNGDLILAIKVVRKYTDLSLGEAKKFVEDLET